MLTLKVSPILFWDIDFTKIDNNQNKRLIIERVISLGDMEDIKEIIQFYGINTIKEEIIKAGYLDNKTLNWASIFLNIPKKNFKCYTNNQSNQAHWNY